VLESMSRLANAVDADALGRLLESVDGETAGRITDAVEGSGVVRVAGQDHVLSDVVRAQVLRTEGVGSIRVGPCQQCRS